MALKKNRFGPPRAAAKKRQKAKIAVLASPTLKIMLDKAATENDRSLSAEAELRLENSFRGVTVLKEASELAYGPQLALLLEIMGREIRKEIGRAGLSQDDDWINDTTAVARARAAVMEIYDRIQPAGTIREIAGEAASGMARRFFIGIGDEKFSLGAGWRERVAAEWGNATLERIITWYQTTYGPQAGETLDEQITAAEGRTIFVQPVVLDDKGLGAIDPQQRHNRLRAGQWRVVPDIDYWRRLARDGDVRISETDPAKGTDQ